MTERAINLPKLLQDTARAIRPMIEQSLDLRDEFAEYRRAVTEVGGDWMALKALVKAQVEDDRDGKGEHTRVEKIIAKADASASYADILNLNKNNYFTEPARGYLTSAEDGRGRQPPPTPAPGRSNSEIVNSEKEDAPKTHLTNPVRETTGARLSESAPGFSPDDLEIPTFLRREAPVPA